MGNMTMRPNLSLSEKESRMGKYFAHRDAADIVPRGRNVARPP
jgi:hypothetical protein